MKGYIRVATFAKYENALHEARLIRERKHKKAKVTKHPLFYAVWEKI